MIEQGSRVYHQEFGDGKVSSVFGAYATVVFFGESIKVKVDELRLVKQKVTSAVVETTFDEQSSTEFRQAFEAVNLGVVPVNPKQIVKLTIGGEKIAEKIARVLSQHNKKGVNNCYKGYYGSGKSHHLQLVKSIAIQEGWVTSLVELDPKGVDPAKPSTVYQEIISKLEFPARKDGKQNLDFFDLIKEIRDNWIEVKKLNYFQNSPWFNRGLSALFQLPHHRHNQVYASGVNWLSGQSKNVSAIRSARVPGAKWNRIPPMPQTLRSGYVYAFHLVVINEILKFLGYKGLLLILDEVEHIRGYTAKRKEHAKHFIQTLKCCTLNNVTDFRARDEEYNWYNMPAFWREGPHFGLFVGLTEDHTDDFEDDDRELEMVNMVTQLDLPSSADYGEWVDLFLQKCGRGFGTNVRMLKFKKTREKLRRVLQENYQTASPTEKVLRNWTKLAGLPAAVLMGSNGSIDEDKLIEIISRSASEIAGERLPWDD